MIGEGIEGKMPCPHGYHHTGKEKGREKEFNFMSYIIVCVAKWAIRRLCSTYCILNERVISCR